VRKQRKTVVLEKILVQDYAAEGRSLARVDGKVVFIEGAVPGDVVDVQLSKTKPTGPRGIRLRYMNYLRTGLPLSASILVFAAVASGRCCHMRNNFFINRNR
jgi:hypothetical protein